METESVKTEEKEEKDEVKKESEGMVCITDKNNNVSFEGLAENEILGIMSVSTFKTAVIGFY
jgi:hypothetical protein